MVTVEDLTRDTFGGFPKSDIGLFSFARWIKKGIKNRITWKFVYIYVYEDDITRINIVIRLIFKI